MEVLFDHQIFCSQIYGGASNYFSELIKRLAKQKETAVRLSILISNNAYLKSIDKPRFISIPKFGLSGKMSRALLTVNKVYSRHLINNSRFDVFHPTYYDPYFLDDIKAKPFVITVFDMIHETYPELFRNHGSFVQWKRELVRRAAIVIAISESTKSDLIEYYRIPENKVKVIHLATSMERPGLSMTLSGFPDRYLLFVGQRAIYKNFLPFIKAIAPIMKSDRSLAIVCAGGSAFTPTEKELFEELKIKSHVFHISPTNAVMGSLYANAICFVFPTLYEGFGLPVLEAFSCGCPVAISNTSALKEVAADAALFFDPRSETEMRNAVSSVISDDHLRKRLVKQGSDRLKSFTWEKTALLTQGAYLTACN